MRRVVQWTTGNVGRRALRAIHAHPELELVGCYAWSEDKVGRDAGELSGIGPIGIEATRDVAALIRLLPDCVSYNPLWPNVDEIVTLLEAGINVSATAAFVTGHGLGPEARDRIRHACKLGGSSIFGTGMNPGFANLLALISAGICDRIDEIQVLESVDATGYASAETQRSVGFGHPADHPELAAMAEKATAVFGDGVYLMADALGVDLDRVTCAPEFAFATETMDLGFMTIEEGCVAGVQASWQGWVGGRAPIDLRVQWKMGQHMEPDWPLEHGYRVRIEGRPRVRTRLDILPPKDFVAKSPEDFMQLGMIITALPAVNAIPALCDAAPGIRTYADLPLITGKGFVAA